MIKHKTLSPPYILIILIICTQKGFRVLDTTIPLKQKWKYIAHKVSLLCSWTVLICSFHKCRKPNELYQYLYMATAYFYLLKYFSWHRIIEKCRLAFLRICCDFFRQNSWPFLKKKKLFLSVYIYLFHQQGLFYCSSIFFL